MHVASYVHVILTAGASNFLAFFYGEGICYPCRLAVLQWFPPDIFDDSKLFGFIVVEFMAYVIDGADIGSLGMAS